MHKLTVETNCKNEIKWVIDPRLTSMENYEFLLKVLQEKKINYFSDFKVLDKDDQYLFILDEKKSKKISHFKNKIAITYLSSVEDIIPFVESFLLAEKYALLDEKIKASERAFGAVKKQLDELKVDAISEEMSREFESILDLEILFLQEDSIEKWNSHIKDFIKFNEELIDLAFVQIRNLVGEDIFVDNNTLIYKLPYEDYYLYFQFKKLVIDEKAALIEMILTMAARSLQVLAQKKVVDDREVELWKKVFLKIPYSMAIISELGDLLIYNELFAQMGILPKECLRFKDLESAEIFQNFYKVRRIDFSIDLIQVSCFVFYTSINNQSMSPTDELGIISSSIAHELNNPLAGILAAISLLQLEEEWTAEAVSELGDMKVGAKRCKELVEIFLGFSKFSPTTKVRLSIKDSLDQAINLLRFRMFESNLRLEIRYSSRGETFSHPVNASVMSMIFYLLCSELMTAFAHHRLITQGQNGILSGEITDSQDQISLKIYDEFEYEDKIVQSKLIQHLLVFEKLEINFLKQEIRLIYRP